MGKEQQPSEEAIVLPGLAIQFGILFLSMGLYFYFHAKITRLKRVNKWGQNLKQVRITDLAIRTKDEMLPSFIYAIANDHYGWSYRLYRNSI